ncbi:MAG: RluA family pseudouridine synthase [Verrucomicrobia bacterium]|jgi:RluA family pseudouridine synthase|nr:RluA family pseudouridine synthase [Verrucomicrobiota bacterium]
MVLKLCDGASTDNQIWYSFSVAKPAQIELPTGDTIPIIFENRSVMAIDKPAGWMLVPLSWQRTNRNLQAAINSSIAAGDFWARSRGLKFLKYVHRLDADTTGVMLLAKSMGAVAAYGDMFENRSVHKTYLAVVAGQPKQREWVCRSKLGTDPNRIGSMRVDDREGKDAETTFRVLAQQGGRTLIQAEPLTGRTHQIRVHLATSGCPIFGDDLYGSGDSKRLPDLGLRAIRIEFQDPFTRQRVRVEAPVEHFLKEFGFPATAMAGGKAEKKEGGSADAA